MYCPLYVKTDYSLLSSLIKIDDLILSLKEKNITSCAIVDDNLYGTMEIIHKFHKNGIKPIIGLDLKDTLLYVKTTEGYYNLIKIETIKNKRELSIEDLKKYKDGLICICFNKDTFDKYKKIYSDIYIGVSNKKEESEYKEYNTVYINKKLYIEKHLYK